MGDGPNVDLDGRVTVMVADPHPVTAELLGRLLEEEPGFSVVGLSRERAELGRMLARHRPRVLVIDPAILKPGGLSQLSILRQASPATRVLVVGMEDGLAWAREAQRLGAAGYLAKDAPLDDWLSALREAADGSRRGAA
jgi:DNA-binding NarL/FixJ family response regulator